jgi:hypothetical protein
MNRRALFHSLWLAALAVALPAAAGNAPAPSPFADVPTSDQAYKVIDEYIKVGLIPGYPVDHRRALTRYELATFTQRTFDVLRRRIENEPAEVFLYKDFPPPRYDAEKRLMESLGHEQTLARSLKQLDGLAVQFEAELALVKADPHLRQKVGEWTARASQLSRSFAKFARDGWSETPFSDVPIRDSAYVLLDELEAVGLPRGTVRDPTHRRTLTRYELAMLARMMFHETRRKLDPDGPRPPGFRDYRRPFDQEKRLLEGLADPGRLGASLARLDTLVLRFERELRMIESDPVAMRRSIAGWIAGAPAHSERLKKELSELKPEKAE